MNTFRKLVHEVVSMRNFIIAFGIAACVGLAVVTSVTDPAPRRIQNSQDGSSEQATTVSAAGTAPTCPLDPAYQFWFPSPRTCEEAPPERREGMWCDDDGSRNDLLRAWLGEKGVVGYGRWAVESRSNHSTSGFRWGFYYQVTDIDGGTPRITPKEIAAFMVAVFGTAKESPHIYLLTITPTEPAVTTVDDGSVYLKDDPTLRESICRLAARNGTEIKLQCDAPSGAGKK